MHRSAQGLFGRLQPLPPRVHVKHRYHHGLKDGEPFALRILSIAGCRYDCIWIQWCLLYLTDADVLTMFDRARRGLKPDGMIVVKVRTVWMM